MLLGASLSDKMLDDAARLWIAFADPKELQLAREAWPGKKYQRATLTTIVAARRALDGDGRRVAALDAPAPAAHDGDRRQGAAREVEQQRAGPAPPAARELRAHEDKAERQKGRVWR